MSLYLVERYTPSLRPEQVAAAVARLGDDPEPGTTHVWTVVVPGEDTCLSLFAAGSATAVARTNLRAGLTFTRIVAVEAIPS
jgi:hypothetical protein